jgi:hypothetical protein
VFRIAQARFVLVLAAALVVPATAQAEGGLFGAILQFFGGGRPEPESTPVPPAPNTVPGAPERSGNNQGNNQSVPPSTGGPQVAFCVRTCDGRYFPLPRNMGGEATPVKICSALCPTAETKIYSGSNIESAYAPDGSRYANLKNAFVYRERLIEGCTCNGGDGAGNAKIDVHSDPTLRPGDIVVTGNGAMVFKGGKGNAHQRSEFTPVANGGRLPPIKVARPGNMPVASPQDVAHGAEPAVRDASAKTDEVSPAEKASAIFDFRDFDTPKNSTAMGYNGRP